MTAVNIHVCVRVRPLNHREKSDRKVRKAVKVSSGGTSTELPSFVDGSPSSGKPGDGAVVNVQLPPNRLKGPQHAAYKQYHPSIAFPPSSSQAKVYKHSNLPTLIQSSLDGYRATLFAYGQTGAGKTHTVLGDDSDPGILFRGIESLYSLAQRSLEEDNKRYTIRVSAIELYNEQVFDLLQTQQRRRFQPLHVREHKLQGFYVDKLTGVRCPTAKSCSRTIKSAVRQRKIGAHDMNARSSRSHLIITLYVDGKSVDGMGPSSFGRLAIVDLAGSERLKVSKSSNVKESGFINKSLYTLGKVINGISNFGGSNVAMKSVQVPYRDSVLTKLLISSLGGECMTTMVACVSPGSDAVSETIRTLGFSMRVKGIMNHPSIHVDEQEKLVTDLKNEIEKLKKENTKLKEMVVEVAQEAALERSTGAAAMNHIGLVNEYDDPEWVSNKLTDDDEEEFFGDEDEEGDDEDEWEEEEGEYEEDEVAADDQQQAEFVQDGFLPKLDDASVLNEEYSEFGESSDEQSQSIGLPELSAPRQQEEPSKLFKKNVKSRLQSKMDTESKITALEYMIEDLRPIATDQGEVEAERMLREYEVELADLKKEQELNEQLAGLGLGGDGEESEDFKKEKELEMLLKGVIGGDGGDKNDNADAKHEESTELNEEPSWKDLWENSLKIMNDFKDVSGQLSDRDDVDKSVPKSLFSGDDWNEGSVFSQTTEPVRKSKGKRRKKKKQVRKFGTG